MLTAVEPWSGNYHVNPQVWMTAHMTQFTSIGDRYLPHGAGSGKLASGGSYVSLVDGKGGLTILIQKASHENSRCIRPALAPCKRASTFPAPLRCICGLELMHKMLAPQTRRRMRRWC